MLKQTAAIVIFGIQIVFGFFPLTASAVESGGVICSPTEAVTAESGTTDIYTCVNRIYRYAIVVGSITAVLFIVIAGYLYMFSGGSDANVSTAKSLIQTSLLGVGILLAGLLILKQVNPEILKLKTISPTRIDGQAWVLPTVGGGGGTTTGTTPPPGGPITPKPVTGGGCNPQESRTCTRAVISACPGMAAQMESALKICNKESAGGQPNIPSGVDKCDEKTTGQRISWSWGLWQLNMFNSTSPEFPECNNVFVERTNPPSGAYRPCTFGTGGRAAFDRCAKALSDPVRNTRQACKLFNEKRGNGIRGWGPWATSRDACGVK